MSYLDFSDHPPAESQFFWGYPPLKSHFFSDYPPAESTKRSWPPPTYSMFFTHPYFCRPPPPIFHLQLDLTPAPYHCSFDIILNLMDNCWLTWCIKYLGDAFKNGFKSSVKWGGGDYYKGGYPPKSWGGLDTLTTWLNVSGVPARPPLHRITKKIRPPPNGITLFFDPPRYGIF